MSRVLVVVSLVLAACGGDDPAFAPKFAVPGDASAAIPIGDLPWPNDIHAVDGHYRIEPETVPLTDQADERVVRGIAAALSERACVGVSSGVVFPLAGFDPADPLVVGEGDVSFVDLTTGDVLPAEVHVRALEGQVFVRPRGGAVLAQGHTYGVTLAAGLATGGGELLGTPGELTSVLDGAGNQRARDAYAPLASYLSEHAIDPASIAGATVFTTCEYTSVFQAVANQIETEVAPTAIIDRVVAAGADLDELLGTPDDDRRPGVDNPGGIAHADIAFVVLGEFQAPNYQSDTPGVLGRWELDAAGVPVRKGYDPVPFLLALPAGIGSYADLPVVVFQHGLSNSRTQVLEVANTLCARGFAVIGIDIPFHGERFPEAVDNNHNFTTDRSPDGIADPSGPTAAMYLFNIQSGDEWLDPRVIQASFGQAIFEMIALGRLITDGDWNALRETAALAQLSFDDHVVFAGESFGGIVGLSAVAYQPRYGAAFLSAAGGGLLNTLLEASPVYGGLFLPILGGALAISPGEIDPAYDPPHTHVGFQLLGPLLDWGDPIAHAQGLLERGRSLAIVSAYADESVPNQASQLLASTIGLDWVSVGGSTEGPRFAELGTVAAPASGNGPSGTTGVFLEVAPATHGMITRWSGEQHYDPEFPPLTPLPEPLAVENPIVELQNTLADFAASYVADGAPTLTDRFQ